MLVHAACAAGFAPSNASGSDADEAFGTALAPVASNLPPAGTSFGAGNPGTKQIQRLDVVEYDNTVRDLTGTELTPAADTFPADDTLNNFDNIATILATSPGLVEAAVGAANTLGAEVTASADDDDARSRIYLRVAPCAAGGQLDAGSCLRQTVKSFGLRAWRRPLSSAEASGIYASAQAAGSDLPTQVGAAVTALLTSPYFMFRVELDPAGSNRPHALNGYELASRLSYFVWRSCPDDQLLAAAADGSLVTDAGLKRHLGRMLGDDRASSLIDGFAAHWLGIDKFADAALDPAAFPGFTEGVRQGMIQETRSFLADIMMRGTPLTQMLTANYSYLDENLARYYGVASPGSDVLKRVTFASSAHRAGVLSQGTLLITGSSGLATSPIRRGYTVLRQLLCSAPPSPPPDIPTLPAEPNANQTTRQLLLAHVANPSCAGCHVEMDNLGFAFEGFDASGRLRTLDNRLPIDSTGVFDGQNAFVNNVDLMALVAADPRFPNCASKALLTYALGRMPDDTDEVLIAGLSAQLTGNRMSVPVLIQQIVLSAAFRSRHG